MPRPLQTRPLPALLLASLVALCSCLVAAPAAATVQEEQAGDEAGQLRQLFTEAEDTFFSAEQPSSIPSFSEIIDRISALGPEERGAELEEMLVASLSYRARARLNLGEDAAASEDLRRILQVDPGFELDPDMVSPKLSETFAELRQELVGTLVVDASPADARVLVDGRRRDWGRPVPLLAGDHVVSVERPGYTVVQREIRVEGAETARVEAHLERTHPVLVLLARPVGATVSIDGQPAGQVREPGDDPLGEVVGEDRRDHPRLRIDGLQVGEHTLRISKEGFRTVEQSVDLPELADYRLGPIDLEPAAGTLLLHGVAEGARIELPGADVAADWQRQPEGDARIELGPGTYTVVVEGTGGSRFETEVEVRDDGTTEVDVDLRPAVTYLGILGGDDLGREQLDGAVRDAVGDSDAWTLRDQRSAAEEILRRLELDAAALRRLADGRAAERRRRFAELRSALDDEITGALYLLGVLSDDLVATAADVWLLPGAPAPAHPDRLTVDLETSRQAVAERIAAVFAPFDTSRGRFGAALVDTGVADAPVVFEIVEGSPAERAGLLLGDQVLDVNGDELAGAGELQRRVEAAGPEGELLVTVRRGTQTMEVRVPLESSPSVVRPDDSSRPLAPLWTQIDSQLRRGDDGATDDWLLELNRVALSMRASDWEAAVQLLRRIRAPEGAGVGAGMVDYWLGIALQALGDDYTELALDAFERAAGQRQARLFHADGPYVWPRARARADALRR